MFLLLACNGPDKDPPVETAPATCDPVAENADAPALVAGAPLAGVAEDWMYLPVGTPLSGYTSRCDCFGGAGEPDKRDSAYRYSFNPSGGVQSPIPLKVVWISNGDQDLVVVKTGLIYVFDGFVAEMEERLSAATGKDLAGKVVVAADHSHQAYGDFSDHVTYYLGSDRFNYEVFTRLAEQAETLALGAHDRLQPVKLGMGLARDWDPTDAVYRDRRGDNNELGFFPDIPDGSFKDPMLSMLRIDTLDDQPLGVLFAFGIHGTLLDDDNPMISSDAPGAVERAFDETFDDGVVVAFIQGGGGDASPASSDDGFARIETTGLAAAGRLRALWETIPTGNDPLYLETASRSVPQLHDEIRVTRGGTTDMHYTPFQEELKPDNVVYDADGAIIPEIDEFNLEFGGAFCGEDSPYLKGYAPAEVEPYSICVPVDIMVGLIKGFFDLTDEESALPLPDQRKAGVTASRLGPLPIRAPDGTEVVDNVLWGFFPGEPTALYTEQFRRRAAAELGYAYSVAVGYAQDHEGYLLIPEDWLLGGYEADINVWGPLQGEHIMEGLLTMAGETVTTDVLEAPDPCGTYSRPTYGEVSLPVAPPDVVGNAGELLTTAPTYLYTPLYTDDEQEVTPLELVSEGTLVPRVQGIVQVAWYGGDPAVDWPLVTLQRATESGGWEPVTNTNGALVRGGPDILVTTTPDPLAPSESLQGHTWLATWQAVAHSDDRAGLPTGTYRLHVEGQEFVGTETTWPWTTASYDAASPSFEVVPGTVTVWPDGAGLRASLRGPERGYRLIGSDGASRGDNPLPDDTATLVLHRGDAEEPLSLTGSRSGGTTWFEVDLTGVTRVDVVDRYGNTGTWVP